MQLWLDSANPAEITEWAPHPWITGVTTNPTLVKAAGVHPSDLAGLTDKPISIDGPPEKVWALGDHVIVKMTSVTPDQSLAQWDHRPVNHTGIVLAEQIASRGWYSHEDVISVFAGRIMDTGRSPKPVIQAAKATRARVLWASVREPYNIVQAELAGCDIVTVPVAILEKYLAWNQRPLEAVARLTTEQFRADAVGIQW